MNTPSPEKSIERIFAPCIVLTVLAGVGYEMCHHAEKSVDAAIGEQRTEETVRRALAKTGVIDKFCDVCEGAAFKSSPIEELRLKSFVETKNEVMKTLGYKGSDLSLTCETFPEGRKAIGTWNKPPFDSKRVSFCNQSGGR